MAKAREITGLRGDMTFAAAAAETVRVRAQEVAEHGEGVLDMTDIERVHAMRVATRRLRAALEIHAICFPKKQFRTVLRDVKALADALGARRDPDVQLAAIGEFAAALRPGEQSGVTVFELELRAAQEHGNATLAAALDEMERSDLIGRLMALADAAAGVSLDETPQGAR